MSNRLIKKFTKCKEGSLGYTLMEMLVVIGIIAIICAIAIPSVVSIVKSLRFAQRNDYAKSIFMAAQANLTEMRADGGLAPLQQAGLDSLPVQEEICGFPVEDWSPEYVYTSSEDSQKVSYALVLPVGSVDALCVSSR
jgi:prepilin-type N-terminal cleavage/methylation domain-containing protein